MKYNYEDVVESLNHEDPMLYLGCLELGRLWREVQEEMNIKEQMENRNEKEE